MPICVVVLKENEVARTLAMQLRSSAIPLLKLELIQPMNQDQTLSNGASNEAEIRALEIKPVALESIPLLNPNLSKQSRQKTMALWLIPFGFITGGTFTQMTGLESFAKLGIDFIPEALTGSLLGMLSGWLGSYIAAGSVNPDKNDDLRSIRKKSDEGFWLLLLETPIEVELPWQLIREMKPIEIITLNDQ